MPITAHAEGGAGAIDAFRKADGAIIASIDSDAKVAAVQAGAEALLDYDWIALQSLDTSFPDVCASSCDEVKRLLGRLMRHNYLKRLRTMDRSRVEYIKEEVGKESTTVKTKVTFPLPDGGTRTVEVDYVMTKTDDKWHVRDIITEGVSLAKNYKYEITRMAKKGGMEKALQTLRARVNKLDAAAAKL